MSLADDVSSVQSDRSFRPQRQQYASSAGGNGTTGHRNRTSAMVSGRRTSVTDAAGNLESTGACIVPMSEANQDDNWGENTTCLTGNTSERSYNYGEVRKFKLVPSDDDLRGRYSSARCSRIASNVSNAAICFLTSTSPVAMIAIPMAAKLWHGPSAASNNSQIVQDASLWHTTECGADCEGLLIGFCVKMVILLFGIWALFVRRNGANLPRLYLSRACLLAFLFLCIFAYWLFYVVRIVQSREADYTVIVTFALSLVDALLFIHYLVIVWMDVLHLRPCYRLHVVRSPDGESRTLLLGDVSIQRAAVIVLQRYYQDFPVYNPYLERPPSRAKKGGGGSQVGSNSTFKIYDVDGRGDAMAMPDVDAKAIMAAAARKRDSGHNERFYEELEWERRVRKRRARLITAAEEAFAHVQKVHLNKGPCSPMDACEAAQAVFPALARTLQKYMRVTKQQPRHPAEAVLRHLSNCLTYDMSARAFLDRFFGSAETPDNCAQYAKWSIVSRPLVSHSLSHGVTFQLRCLSPGCESAVSLLCSVTKLPFLDLTEEPLDPKADVFVLKFNSETSV